MTTTFGTTLLKLKTGVANHFDPEFFGGLGGAGGCGGSGGCSGGSDGSGGSGCFKRSHIKIYTITKLFIIEQLREPNALLWTTLSPCALFYFMASSKHAQLAPPDYTSSSSWFYAYIACSSALFGLSYYLIGRRESGFIRSFIYNESALRLFLTSHILSNSCISAIHFSIFYLITKPMTGAYSITEYTFLLTGFYISYLGFASIGLIFTMLPIKFSTAGTLFSIFSFAMLVLGFISASATESSTPLSRYNPLALIAALLSGDIPLLTAAVAVAASFLFSLYLAKRYFRIQPVWSRY